MFNSTHMGSYMLTNINFNEMSLRNVNKLDFGKLYTISGTSFIKSLYQNDKKSKIVYSTKSHH